MRVGILGAGRWGQALGRLAKAAGNQPLLAYRERRPPHILPSTRDAEEVSATCELLLVATSAAEVRSAIRLAKPGGHNRVVVAGRGVDPASGQWLTDVVLDSSEALRVGALAGPAPVDEILNGGLCAGVVASSFDEVRQLTTRALHSSRYRVYESTDVAGVQVAGAAVPVLAMLVGLATRLGGAGVGLHALVVARGIEEMARLTRALGGKQATIAGLAGLGDLVAVQGVPSHPYHQAGANLAAPSEARSTGLSEAPLMLARALLEQARQVDVELPLTAALVAIADGGVDPLDAVGGLMGRQAVPETD